MSMLGLILFLVLMAQVVNLTVASFGLGHFSFGTTTFGFSAKGLKTSIGYTPAKGKKFEKQWSHSERYGYSGFIMLDFYHLTAWVLLSIDQWGPTMKKIRAAKAVYIKVNRQYRLRQAQIKVFINRGSYLNVVEQLGESWVEGQEYGDSYTDYRYLKIAANSLPKLEKYLEDKYDSGPCTCVSCLNDWDCCGHWSQHFSRGGTRYESFLIYKVALSHQQNV